MKKTKSISDFVNINLKAFSKYVTYSRAIPSLIDGFKPVNRKAFYIMKNRQANTKVLSVSGLMIADANYHHGDVSASNAISLMAQDFPGANNIPVFNKKGSFGNQLITEPSAPRYIYVRSNPTYNALFKDYELCPASDDLDDPEPKYYIPIIPTVLLNGISGIAVGFATEIQPFSLKDITNNVKRCITGAELQPMMPYYKGFMGKIEQVEPNKWTQTGIHEVVNTTTIKITEIPTKYDRAKYLAFLTKMIDDGHIKSYREESKKTWNLIIKLPRRSKIFKDPVKYLNLEKNLNNNLTVIDEDGLLQVFNSPEEIIKHFVAFRMKVYLGRKKFMMDKLKNDIFFNREKIYFIMAMSKINFKTMTKSNIFDKLIKTEKFTKDNLVKLLKMEASKLNLEEMKKTKQHIEELKKEWTWYKEITPTKLYVIDLENIKGV